jgi:hypothetical protein
MTAVVAQPNNQTTAERELINHAEHLAEAATLAELDALRDEAAKPAPEPETETEADAGPEADTELGAQPEAEADPEPQRERAREPEAEPQPVTAAARPPAPFDYEQEPDFDHGPSIRSPLSDSDWAWTQLAAVAPKVQAPPPAPPAEPTISTPAVEAVGPDTPIDVSAKPETRTHVAEPPIPGRPPASPTPEAPGDQLSLAERSRVRRRIRYLRKLREVQLRDLGGFVLELHRYGRERPDLVRAKVESAAGTDRELRELELVLEGSSSLRELREAGIGGACQNCGAVHGSSDRFCSACGEPLEAAVADRARDDA